MKHFSKLLAGAALAAVFAGSALAQSAPQQQDRHQWMQAHRGEFRARMCNDMYAHHVGMVAELGARLDLTDSQRPAFERWKTVVLDGAKHRQSECLAHQANMEHRPTIVEREARMREHLKARLAMLDAQAPAMDALYASLSPEQKTVLDHMGHRGGGMRGGFHGMHRGMWHHGGPDAPPPQDSQG